MSRLGLRSRLFLVVVATVAIVLAALLAVFNLVLDGTLDGNARDLARSRATAEISSLRFEGGELKAGGAPDDRGADAFLWIFSGSRVLEQPAAAAELDRAAHGLAGASRQFADVASTDTRLYAEPVLVHGRRIGTVVAGVSLSAYEQTRATTLEASLVFGAIALVP